MKIIGKAKVAACLLFAQMMMFFIGISPGAGVRPGQMGLWDWSFFLLGVATFLSLSAMLLVYLFEGELGLCGEPGVFPAWAAFFGCVAPVATNLAPGPVEVTPPLFFQPKVRNYSFTCKACGAANEVPFLGAACEFCGEAPPKAADNRGSRSSKGSR
jgi:hypothetical protein